jgi:hypothetical protein
MNRVQRPFFKLNAISVGGVLCCCESNSCLESVGAGGLNDQSSDSRKKFVRVTRCDLQVIASVRRSSLVLCLTTVENRSEL